MANDQQPFRVEALDGASERYGAPFSKLGICGWRLTFTVLILTSLCLPQIADAETGARSGWRDAVADDVRQSEDWTYRRGSPNLSLFVTADFDGDGRKDRAYLAVNDTDRMYGLFAALSSDGSVRMLERGDMARLPNLGLRKLKPGKYERECGDRSPPRCQPWLVLDNAGFAFFKFEAGEAVYYYRQGSFVSEVLLEY